MAQHHHNTAVRHRRHTAPVRSEGTAKAHFVQGLVALVALMALVALVVPATVVILDAQKLCLNSGCTGPSQGDLDQKKSPSRCRCHWCGHALPVTRSLHE